MEKFKDQPDYSEAVKLLEKTYATKFFTANDWNHLHDAILDATWKGEQKSCSLKEMVEIYRELPHHLKEIAIQWGMNDTVFREGVITFYRRKHDII
jgi:hypothetical protein